MIRAARSTAMKRAVQVSVSRSASLQPIRTISSLKTLSGVSSKASGAFNVMTASMRPAMATPFLSRGYAAEAVKVPFMSESISEGTLSTFHKGVGDFVKADEEVASIETDKIDVPVNAPYSGIITELLAQPEDTVTVDQDLFMLEAAEEPAGGAAKKEAAAPKEEAKEEPKQEVKEESKPAPKQEESKPAPKKEESKPAAAAEPEVAARPATGSFSREENVVKMNRMRLRISERLKESQNTAASLTTFNEVDMSSVLEIRKLYKDEILKKTGVKLGFMGLFSKAVTTALKENPAVNASIVGTDMVFRDYVDISVAVATPKGLVTPVIRNAESLDVVGIEAEIVRLGQKARDGKLSMEDMAGGTFTISNGGVFGSLMGTPIINMPQSAVLGLHGVKDRPVAVDGKVEIRPMMYIALTYDHRIIDGREAVTFLRTVKELIEDPRKILLL